MKSIGDVIRSLRIEKGLTQEELGEHLNCGKTAISNWETGFREPKIKYKEALCNFFDIDYNYLMGMSNVKKNILKSINEVKIPLHKSDIESPIVGFISFSDANILNSDYPLGFFAITSENDTFVDKGIVNGSVLLFAYIDNIDNNSIGYFNFNSSYLTRLITFDNNDIYLSVPNKDHLTIKTNFNNIRVIGKLIAVLNKS